MAREVNENLRASIVPEWGFIFQVVVWF